ncbi:MAG: pseudouridine synthase [Firmicutes bacterium]|nr:pseudouridine synthase [Bacillota bacterium]
MRLQKMLASAGVASRRQSEEWIAAGRVQVNGQVIREMGFQVTAQDRVVVDGKPIAGPEELVYILLYKPTGCVTTTSDPYDRKKVTDFVTGVKARLFPVGRLDYETDGALILTNDGELANRLMHPRFGVTKAYQAVVQGQMTAETIAILERGVLLDGEMTAPSQAVMLGTDGKTTKIEIRIHEGRNRQVRRMLEAVRHPVLSLTRVAYGPLSLRGLRPGTWRHLTEYEVQLLQTPPAPAQKPREKGPRKRRS